MSQADPLPSVPTAESIPRVEDGTVVWHRRHLRTADHPAIAAATAAEDSQRILPLFVFDPTFYGRDGLACDARIRFLHESLTELAAQYEAAGGRLVLGHGDPVDLCSRFIERGWEVVATADPTGRYGHRRDTEAAAAGVQFIDDDGLRRGVADSRAGWSDHVEEWFNEDPHSFDATVTTFETVETVETPITVDRIESAYGVEPRKERVPRGGREPGWRRLEQFARAIGSYPGSISAPSDAKTGTSRLSPYLRFGCLSVREVFQYVEREAPDGRGKQMFRSRLYWNRHYNQKLADWPGWMDTAVNPVMEGFHADNHDPELVESWKAGQTGYPMVDASMRCLRATGWLNFRMRAMCASFLCDLLQQPWKVGADWFYYHLIDADPAINYTQFQTQAGLVGVNMLRIYNPRKQVRDNDPDGAFIGEWVPELRELPTDFLDQPEKTPLSVQDACGIQIGEEYPYPVIEYEAARERIIQKFETVSDEAEAALRRPEVAARASLSRRGSSRESGASDTERGDEQDSTDGSDTQSSLSEFE